MLSNERKKIAGSEFQKNLTGRANARTFVIGGCSHEKCQYRLDLDTVVTKTDFRVHKKRPKGEVVRTLNGNDKRPKTNPRIWRRTMKNQAGGGGGVFWTTTIHTLTMVAMSRKGLDWTATPRQECDPQSTTTCEREFYDYGTVD